MGHGRAFLIASAVAGGLTVVAKGGIDLFVPTFLVWMLVSAVAARRSRGTVAFALLNVVLLVGDAGIDVLAMGQHLPDGAVGVLPWRFGGDQTLLIGYWIALWAIAVPQRTLAMLRRTSADPAWQTVLLVAVIGLHVGFVEDVVYFALLGFPPWQGPPPLDYRYLPTLPGLPTWTSASVWTVSAVAAAGYVLVSVGAVLSRRRQASQPVAGGIHGA